MGLAQRTHLLDAFFQLAPLLSAFSPVVEKLLLTPSELLLEVLAFLFGFFQQSPMPAGRIWLD